MHNRLTLLASSILLASISGGAAQAALYAVAPAPADGDLSTGGYAPWYQDTHGRTLDLCQSKAISSRAPGTAAAPGYMCTLNPAPGEFDPAQPMIFPTNWPDETFWFTADAAITDAASGIDLGYGAAIEAAFNGDIADGNQVSFARVRIRVDVPVAGVYTVTHPYGVEVFNVTPEEFTDTGGDRAINMTRDIGIGTPRVDYSGALKGDIGPFLRSVNGPYTESNPANAGQLDKFIGDPNIEEQVTGSPFNTNYVRIQGPNGIDLRTDLFSISGKLSTEDLPAPNLVQRATYSRENSSGGLVVHQDVFTMAPPPPGTATFLDSAGAAVTMTEANSTGSWYGQSTANPSLPATLQVTADNHLAIPTLLPPTTVPAQLTDLVTITRAEYNDGQLTIEASTSDRTSPPTLTAYAGDSGVLIGELSGGADKSRSSGIGAVPPATVRVTSANGGSDTEEVVIVQ
ncbi:hypothetical protein D3C76_330860 [compost metagenome]